MSRYSESMRRDAQDRQNGLAVLTGLFDECPCLAEAIAGTRNPDGTWLVPAATLMLFLDGGRLKFCLSPCTGQQVCFGVVSDPSKGLLSVEEALQSGDFEWKDRKGKRGG